MAGFMSGFVDRFQTLQDEKRIAAAEKAVALQKAARQRVEDHMKLAPVSMYSEGKLDLENTPVPEYMSESYRSAVHGAVDQYKKGVRIKNQEDFAEKYAKGETPEYNLIRMELRMRAGDPSVTPIQKQIHEAVTAGLKGENKIFDKYGGVQSWLQIGAKKREEKRRKAVVDKLGKHRSDMFHLFGRLGESIVLSNKLLESSSLYGGMTGGPFQININPGSDISASQGQQNIHDADIRILMHVSNLLKNDKEFRKAFSENRKGIRTHFKDHYDNVASKPPVLAFAGRDSGGNTGWLAKAAPDLAKAINEKTTSVSGDETVDAVDAQLGRRSEKLHNDPLRITRNSQLVRNLGKINSGRVVRNDNIIANSLLLKNDVTLVKNRETGKWSLPQNIGITNKKLGEADPHNGGLTYRQSFAIKGAFNAFQNGSMEASEYLNFVKAQIPKLNRQSITNIESSGQIFEMTATAIEASSVPFTVPVYMSTPSGTYKNESENPAIIQSRYDSKNRTHLNQMNEMMKRGETLAEISDELKTILGYISDSGRLDGIDSSLVDKENLTGFSSELIQKIDNFGIEAGKFVEGIKGRFFNPDGEDPSLTAALTNDELSENNRRQLQNISERAKRLAQLGDKEGLRDAERRTYQRRAILEFKKLALTYKMSGLVQGEATGGRTISNQDFEVMLKALWGTQEASKVRLQSLLQRIGTARAANNVQMSQFRRGTREIMMSDPKMDQLRFAMYNDFHKKMRTGETPANIVDADGKIVGAGENENLTRSRDLRENIVRFDNIRKQTFRNEYAGPTNTADVTDKDRADRLFVASDSMLNYLLAGGETEDVTFNQFLDNPLEYGEDVMNTFNERLTLMENSYRTLQGRGAIAEAIESQTGFGINTRENRQLQNNFRVYINDLFTAMDKALSNAIEKRKSATIRQQ